MRKGRSRTGLKYPGGARARRMTKEQRVSETKRIYKFGKDAQGNNVTEGSAQD